MGEWVGAERERLLLLFNSKMSLLFSFVCLILEIHFQKTSKCTSLLCLFTKKNKELAAKDPELNYSCVLLFSQSKSRAQRGETNSLRLHFDVDQHVITSSCNTSTIVLVRDRPV